MLQKYPFFRLVVFLIVGILLGKYCVGLQSVTLLVGALFCMLSYFVLSRKNRYVYQWMFGLSIGLLITYMGIEQTRWQESQLVDSFQVLLEEEQREEIAVQIVDVPLEKPKSVQLLVKMLPDSLHQEVNLQLYVKKDSVSLTLKEGDWIALNRKALKDRKQESDNGFDFDAYLRGRGISGSFYIPEYRWRFLSETQEFSFIRLSHSIQKYLVNVFRENKIGGKELGVLAALTIGDKTLLDKDLRKSYSTTGASHILAVSGLHVGVIFLVFTKILSQILRGERLKKMRIVLALTALWIFAFVTGLSPSVVRASIMLTIGSMAVIFGRHSLTYNAVFASAFLMLLYSPRYLFDISFQLSYLAVLSILMFQQPIYNTIVFQNKFMDSCWSLLSVSLAAQLGTLPLTLYYFHQLSNVFWLSGYVVIPLSSIIIYLSIALWMTSWVPWVGSFVSFVLSKIVWGMNEAIQWMETMVGAVREDVRMLSCEVVWLYIMMIVLFLSVRKLSFRRLSAMFVAVFVYSVFQTINKIFFVT